MSLQGDEEAGPNQTIEVISGGNFHGEPLALAFDYLAIALTDLGNISERRIMRLTDEASNAHILPAFLTEEGGLNSGFMIVQYTAASTLHREQDTCPTPPAWTQFPVPQTSKTTISSGCNFRP